ncbi:hypothetical protein [Tardiphaga sp. 862_B3_N1_1]|uniref:hypothetical protein n=1 Tax=Tardiphaga sp. 862_B3_N1_1 TaxID=3240763 RepID=UPI003F8A1A99
MDEKAIEGSAARAADRGRAEDLGFVPSDKPSLGNPDTVRALVSEFGAAIVGVRAAWLRAGGAGNPVESTHDLAKEYGRVIMGHDDRYQVLPWNNPDRLGRRIRLVCPAEDAATDPGELLFLTIGASLMEISAAHEQGRLSDVAAEAHTKTMLEDTANLILGVR